MNFINLLVEGINQEGNRIIIKSGGKSYSFFVTKQDGTQSRAYQDYMKGVQIGKTYSFGVTESMGKSQDGRDITYRNIGVISEARGNTPSVAPQNAPQAPYQPQAIPTQPQATNYQTMSDFEVKLLAEVNRLATGYEKLYNEVKLMRIGSKELNQEAMAIHEGDNQLHNLQNVGLEPSNTDIPIVEENLAVDNVPF
ncbi:MAG: hypothetical protein EOM29_09555 [Bacteroidia bacterium]|nr:hypothetical protein [Bacteroidia bacterium]